MSSMERTLQRLQPGEHCRISEERWAQELERGEPLHQWGSCFLTQGSSGDDSAVWVWFRDSTPEGRHTAAHLDPQATARALQGVLEVEAAARRSADLVTATRERGRSTLDQQREEVAASEQFTLMAEELYRELLTFGPSPASS